MIRTHCLLEVGARCNRTFQHYCQGCKEICRCKRILETQFRYILPGLTLLGRYLIQSLIQNCSANPIQLNPRLNEYEQDKSQTLSKGAQTVNYSDYTNYANDKR